MPVSCEYSSYEGKKTEKAALPPVAIIHVVAVVDVDCMAVRLDRGEKFLGLEVLVALSAYYTKYTTNRVGFLRHLFIQLLLYSVLVHYSAVDCCTAAMLCTSMYVRPRIQYRAANKQASNKKRRLRCTGE